MNAAQPKLPPALFALLLTFCLSGCDKKAPGSDAPRNEPAPAAQAATPPPQAPTQSPSPAPQPAPIVVAPVAAPMDFGLSLPCISNPLSVISAYQGRPVVLFYFGPTCPHCQHAFPEVQAYGDGLRSRGIETLAIATSRSNAEEIRGFMRTFQARIPVFWDSDRKFGDAYDIKLLPTLFLVGANGGMHRLDHFAGKASLDSLLAKL